MPVSAPHWDVSNIYPSLESKEYQSRVKIIKASRGT